MVLSAPPTSLSTHIPLLPPGIAPLTPDLGCFLLELREQPGVPGLEKGPTCKLTHRGIVKVSAAGRTLLHKMLSVVVVGLENKAGEGAEGAGAAPAEEEEAEGRPSRSAAAGEEGAGRGRLGSAPQ